MECMNGVLLQQEDCIELPFRTVGSAARISFEIRANIGVALLLDPVHSRSTRSRAGLGEASWLPVGLAARHIEM